MNYNDLSLPSPDQYIFLTEMFTESVSSNHYYGNEEYDHASMRDVAAIQAISDESLKALCSIFKFVARGVDITDKASLQNLALSCLGKASFFDRSPEFVEAELIVTAAHSKNINWRLLVDVHNQSSDQDRSAIRQLFNSCFNTDIENIFRAKGPTLDIPKQFQHQDAAVEIEGEFFIKDASCGQWIKEELFHEKLVLIAAFQKSQTGKIFDNEVIGSSGHLDTAIALATAFAAQKISVEPGIPLKKVEGIFIYNNDNTPIAVANCTQEISKPDNHAVMMSGRLVWDISQSDDEASWSKLMDEKFDNNIQRLIEEGNHKDANTLIKEKHEKKESLRKALFPYNKETFNSVRLEVEEAMGVSWGKVHDLETSLGL